MEPSPQKSPILEDYCGITVVRDDLYPGGTKARFIRSLFEGTNELVYASPAEGGAQYSLAFCARELGKRATIFVARRTERHPRFEQIQALGAKVIEVAPGYLSVVRARAREYTQVSRGRLLPFGLDMPIAQAAIASAARMVPFQPDEVWCASGSGVLARALASAWPVARMNVVAVGRELSLPSRFKIWQYPAPFGSHGPTAPFPSDSHYDAKAWSLCHRNHGAGRVLFWNVLGNPEKEPRPE